MRSLCSLYVCGPLTLFGFVCGPRRIKKVFFPELLVIAVIIRDL
jgi:hypothetical protein